jgi:hypothetical protein
MTNYAEKIFGKNPVEITLDDIKEFFSVPQEESSVLEFKSGGSDIIDIFKEVAAFLNTEGGLLIIGSPRERIEEIGKNKVRVCQGDLELSKFSNKDWLYQKIASNIVPTPVNLKIHEFLTTKGNVFLVDVPQSLNPPHQNSADGRYYLRLEREAKPAPHGIIQALFDKRRVPLLKCKINIDSVDDLNSKISINIFNKSNIPAEKVSFTISTFNVNSITSNFNFSKDEEYDLKKFHFSSNVEQILVQVISAGMSFNIEHNDKDFAIMVGYWCKNLDFHYKYIFYSPSTSKALKVEEGNGDFNFYQDLKTYLIK